ncbi:Aldo/keto reductase [Auricularia subglabra TFB-10046 SS5]|nr:Aldo/keto reductase [Auricularia subglabra TFB-10046 SS5]
MHIAPTQLPTVTLGDIACPRIIVGLWQLSSANWGSANVDTIHASMAELASRGFTAFDMADHYGDAEIRFGDFKSSISDPRSIVAATKWCVFRPMSVTRDMVEAALSHRLRRLKTESVDLLQFHWNDYNDKGYLDALRHLAHFHDEGKIRAVGLCNFDTEHLVEVCRALPQGFIVSNQVQFSLIDTRPLSGMVAACEQYGVKLLTYGTLCGGLLSNRFLDAAQPDPYSTTFTTSMRKYLDMINVWGTWDEFKQLLKTLNEVAHRHHESISVANVATKWVLDQPAVGAVILGARLGVSSNIEDNVRVFQWELTTQDRADIERAAMLGRGKQLLEYLGDCGGEYR